MLEKYKIKFCLSVGRILNHNKCCSYATIIMLCISITEISIQCYPGTLGPLSEGLIDLTLCCIPDVGLRVGSKPEDAGKCHDPNIASILKMVLSCAAWEFFQNLRYKTEQNWMGSSLPLVILSSYLNSSANFWGIIPGLELMRYIIPALRQPR